VGRLRPRTRVVREARFRLNTDRRSKGPPPTPRLFSSLDKLPTITNSYWIKLLFDSGGRLCIEPSELSLIAQKDPAPVASKPPTENTIRRFEQTSPNARPTLKGRTFHIVASDFSFRGNTLFIHEGTVNPVK
jgi:hypothetical protein